MISACSRLRHRVNRPQELFVVDMNEITLSTHDAATLAAVIATFSPYEAPVSVAAEELAEMLAGAKVVAPGALGRNVVGLDSEVTYVEQPAGRTRTVRLVHPASADASAARISVFAPVARALLGRRAGAHVPVALPDSTIDGLHVVAVRRDRSAS
jgi:transcription elongation GreA/GreB family factor